MMSLRLFQRTLFALMAVGFIPVAISMPTFEEFRSAHQSSEAVLVDRHGAPLYERRVNPHQRRLPWLEVKDVPQGFLDLLLLSEDQHFFEHAGVDWWALAKTASGNLFSNKPRGASTLTMQTAGLIKSGKGIRRGLREKFEQISDAIELEHAWTKTQILEAYLNTVSFRGELQGLATASKALFQKEAHGLTLEEAALLVALIPNPGSTSTQVVDRACRLLEKKRVACHKDSLVSIADAHLDHPSAQLANIRWAPHVAFQMLKPGVQKATTTLDARIQITVLEALERQLKDLKDRNVKDGAVLVVDNRTSEVLAYVGSRGRLSANPFVDGVQAPRSAGSTLKPFLYGLAFERRMLAPSTLVLDSPADISVGNSIFRPKNYDQSFRGWVTAREALGSSLNVPAVRTLDQLGVERFVGELARLGFRELDRPERYGLSVALGSASVRLWDLVQAYHALARGGEFANISFVPGEAQKSKVRVLSNQSAYLVSDVLSDREARAGTFGLESPLSTRYWTAVKTGTSKDMTDNWCVGYSQNYTVGVWVGNFNGDPMWNVSGITGSAPVWLEVMNTLHEHSTSRAPEVPRGLVRKTINGKSEVFIVGTEPHDQFVASNGSAADLAHLARIVYPVSGMLVAIDPDVPQENSGILLEASQKGLDWFADGKKIGSSSDVTVLKPIVGTHRLELRTAGGELVDHTQFQVKGSL